jgi:hypothetical protein
VTTDYRLNVTSVDVGLEVANGCILTTRKSRRVISPTRTSDNREGSAFYEVGVGVVVAHVNVYAITEGVP